MINDSFPLDLYDRLDPKNQPVVVVSASDAKRLRAFLVGMNKLDGLLKAVDLDQLAEPAANELRAFLKRTE